MRSAPESHKSFRDIPLPLLGIWQKHQANNNIYVEDLIQIHAGVMIATLISVSLYESCLVDLVYHILLMSSILPDSYSPFSSSLMGFVDLQGVGLNGEFPLSLAWVSTPALICCLRMPLTFMSIASLFSPESSTHHGKYIGQNYSWRLIESAFFNLLLWFVNAHRLISSFLPLRA